LLSSLKEEVDVLLDEYRFGITRKYLSMSWQSQLFLADQGRKLFTTWPGRMDERKSSWMPLKKDDDKYVEHSTRTRTNAKTNTNFQPRSYLPRLPVHSSAAYLVDSGVRSFLLGGSYPSFYFGQEVYYDCVVDGNNEHFAGTIIGVSNSGGYDIAFYGEDVETLGSVQKGIQRKSITPREPVKEGTRVMANYMGNGNYFPATVMFVLPDGSVDLVYDDGDEEQAVQYYRYDTIIA